jgi:hypothetical protein
VYKRDSRSINALTHGRSFLQQLPLHDSYRTHVRNRCTYTSNVSGVLSKRKLLSSTSSHYQQQQQQQSAMLGYQRCCSMSQIVPQSHIPASRRASVILPFFEVLAYDSRTCSNRASDVWCELRNARSSTYRSTALSSSNDDVLDRPKSIGTLNQSRVSVSLTQTEAWWWWWWWWFIRDGAAHRFDRFEAIHWT